MRPKLSTDMFLGAAALVLVVFLALARAVQQQGAAPSSPSSYDAGRYGYRALYEVLRRERVAAIRFTRNHHFLDRRTGTLVVAQPAFDALANRSAGVSRNDILNIKDWVRRGGVLVVLAPPYGSAYDTLLGIPASRKASRSAHVAIPFVPSALAQGVSSVTGEFANEFALDASAKALPMLLTTSGIVVMRYRLGTGTIVVSSDYGILSNENLGRADNARFAVQLFAGLPSPVAFDETIHGYAVSQSLWSALPGPVHIAAYLAIFALLLAILGSLWRFAPPVAPARASERDSSAYIAAMADLLAHARASGKVLRDDADSALRAVRRACGLSDRTPVAVVLKHLRDPQQRQAVLELDRLRDLERPSANEFVRAGALCSQLRKDFV